jgi:hypothetical protein
MRRRIETILGHSSPHPLEKNQIWFTPICLFVSRLSSERKFQPCLLSHLYDNLATPSGETLVDFQRLTIRGKYSHPIRFSSKTRESSSHKNRSNCSKGRGAKKIHSGAQFPKIAPELTIKSRTR